MDILSCQVLVFIDMNFFVPLFHSLKLCEVIFEISVDYMT